MSDSPEGPGWWQASDGKWYPPEQAPGYQQPGAAPAGGAGGTDIGSVFTFAWNKFIQNIGEWIILWLIMVGAFVLYIILSIVIAVGGAAGGFSLRFNFVGIIVGLLWGALFGVILVAIAKAANMAALGQKVDVGAAFKLTGNNIIAGAVFGLIFGVLYSFCSIFGIAAFLLLGFVPVISAMDDKGADALSEAFNLATKNPAEGLLWNLIFGLLVVFLYAIGTPIGLLGGVYLVKSYRGEAVAP